MSAHDQPAARILSLREARRNAELFLRCEREITQSDVRTLLDTLDRIRDRAGYHSEGDDRRIEDIRAIVRNGRV